MNSSTNSLSSRELSILHLKSKVFSTANYLIRKLPRHLQDIHIDDFIQAGWVGAIDAVDKYESTKGDLVSYAGYRIRGSILDYMRTCDFLSRDHRRFTKGSNLAPKNISLEGFLGGDLYTFDVKDKDSLKPFGSIDASETVLKILRNTPLSDRCRKVLLDYYWKDRTLKQISKKLHVSESRVSQLHHQSLSLISQTS